tara:strand:- start:28 stop:570 length:543 start_codon:yes stop_codon:yes gene_type:complete
MDTPSNTETALAIKLAEQQSTTSTKLADQVMKANDKLDCQLTKANDKLDVEKDKYDALVKLYDLQKERIHALEREKEEDNFKRQIEEARNEQPAKVPRTKDLDEKDLWNADSTDEYKVNMLRDFLSPTCAVSSITKKGLGSALTFLGYDAASISTKQKFSPTNTARFQTLKDVVKHAYNM